jgi:hypothetical protein
MESRYFNSLISILCMFFGGVLYYIILCNFCYGLLVQYCFCFVIVWLAFWQIGGVAYDIGM